MISVVLMAEALVTSHLSSIPFGQFFPVLLAVCYAEANFIYLPYLKVMPNMAVFVERFSSSGPLYLNSPVK